MAGKSGTPAYPVPPRKSRRFRLDVSGLAVPLLPKPLVQIGGSSQRPAVASLFAPMRVRTTSTPHKVRGLFVHAIHDRAKQVYTHHGFQVSPQHPMTLMLCLNTVKARER